MVKTAFTDKSLMFIIHVSAAQALRLLSTNETARYYSLFNDHSTALTIVIDFSLQSHVQVVTFAPMKETQLFESPQLSCQVGGNNSYAEKI